MGDGFFEQILLGICDCRWCVVVLCEVVSVGIFYAFFYGFQVKRLLEIIEEPGMDHDPGLRCFCVIVEAPGKRLLLIRGQAETSLLD